MYEKGGKNWSKDKAVTFSFPCLLWGSITALMSGLNKLSFLGFLRLSLAVFLGIPVVLKGYLGIYRGFRGTLGDLCVFQDKFIGTGFSACTYIDLYFRSNRHTCIEICLSKLHFLFIIHYGNFDRKWINKEARFLKLKSNKGKPNIIINTLFTTL